MLWKRILANVLGIPLDVVKTSEGPGYGAALLAMVACGEYETVAQACSALVRTVDTVEPDASLTALYEERYRQFRRYAGRCFQSCCKRRPGMRLQRRRREVR